MLVNCVSRGVDPLTTEVERPEVPTSAMKLLWDIFSDPVCGDSPQRRPICSAICPSASSTLAISLFSLLSSFLPSLSFSLPAGQMAAINRHGVGGHPRV